MTINAIVSSFVLGSALLFASTVFATDTSQPLTRGDCSSASMRWDERANVCKELTSTAGQTGSSTVFPAATISQPLTRADCGKAGLRWDEGVNVCAESTSTAGQAEAGPDFQKLKRPHHHRQDPPENDDLRGREKNMTGGCQQVDRGMQPLLELILLRP